MAEFQEVMKQWSRMCKAYYRCVDCPLERCIDPQRNTWHDEDGDIFSRIEETAKEWAEPHPELVYPTWEEWLEEVGFVKKTIMNDFIHREYCWKEHISPDIAKKLGIKPKEG